MKEEEQMVDSWTNKVCELCGSMFVSTVNLKRLASVDYIHLTDPNRLLIPRELNEVEKSRANGCKFCKKIWEAIHGLGKPNAVQNTCLEELAKIRAENPTADWIFNLSFSSSLPVPDERNDAHPWTDIEHVIISIETVGGEEKARIAYFDFYALPGMGMLLQFSDLSSYSFNRLILSR